MSISYCDYCNRHIDTDLDAEHFDCADQYECVEEEMEEEPEENEADNARRYEQNIALSEFAKEN